MESKYILKFVDISLAVDQGSSDHYIDVTNQRPFWVLAWIDPSSTDYSELTDGSKLVTTYGVSTGYKTTNPFEGFFSPAFNTSGLASIMGGHFDIDGKHFNKRKQRYYSVGSGGDQTPSHAIIIEVIDE